MEKKENGNANSNTNKSEGANAHKIEEVETSTLVISLYYSMLYQINDEEKVVLYMQQIEENITLGLPLPVVYINTKKEVIHGHWELLAIQRLGWKMISVIIIDVDEDTEKELTIRLNSQNNLNDKSWKVKGDEIEELFKIYEKRRGRKPEGAVSEINDLTTRQKIAKLMCVTESHVQQIRFIYVNAPSLLVYLDEKGGKLSTMYELANDAKAKKDMKILDYFINGAITYEQAKYYTRTKRTCKKGRKSTKPVDRKSVNNSCPLWGKPECLRHLTNVIYDMQPNTDESTN